MAPLAILGALAAAGLVAVPGIGKFAAVGVGLLAAPAGMAVFRHAGRGPGARLLGAAAATLAAVASLLGGAKIALTLVAIEHVARLAP